MVHTSLRMKRERERDLFDGISDLGTDAIAGEESGPDQIGAGSGGEEAPIQNPRWNKGGCREEVVRSSASEDSSRDMGSHSRTIFAVLTL